jgi:hypothetical protein
MDRMPVVQDGAPVRLGLGHQGGADIAARAGAVLDDHRLLDGGR